jgi:TPR repeat protein
MKSTQILRLSFVSLILVMAIFVNQSANGEASDFNNILKAAQEGDPNAQVSIGLMYEEGEGVTQNYQEAVRWYRKAAEQGLALAQSGLGKMYELGHGVTQDYEEAIKWDRKAAEQGLALAQWNLGAKYADGKKVNRDYKEAVKWLKKAAEQDFDEAQFDLGLMFEYGDGVTQDYQEAIKWYKKAADHGNAKAQRCLGGMYFEGNGVVQDYVESYKWLILAAAQGDQAASKVRNLMNGVLTAQQIAEAQRLAKNFKPKSNNHDRENSTTPNQGDKVATSGTGFFITSNGYIVTAYHVIKDAVKVKLVTNQGIKTAVVVKADSTNDIAILKAEKAQYLSLPITSSMGVKLGADVFTVGFPNVQLQGFEPKYTKGNISSLSGIQDDTRHFQISAPVQPGNSGGPLIDSTGNVIGIVVAKMGDVETLTATGSIPQNVNYAIKSSFALALLETLPEASQNLKPPFQKERNSADVVDEAQKAVVLILCY